MNILARMFLRAAKAAGAHPRDPLIAEWFGGTSTQAGVSVTADNAMQVTAVYACVKVIAETIASLPCIVYRYIAENRGQERDPSHPLYVLLHDRPNRWQTTYEWTVYMLSGFLLRGNAYAEKVATGRRAVSELIPLNPRRVRPVLVDGAGNPIEEMSADARLVYWYTPASGKARVILQSEMLHVRGITRNGIVGLSPIELHREAVGDAVATRQYGSRFFANDAQPRGGVKIPGTFKDLEAVKRFRKSWKDAQGGENQHSVAVFEGGAEWVDIGMSNEDAQFLETRKYQIADIAGRIYRVPLHMVGELDRATFSNIEQQSIEFVRDTIRPYLIMLEQCYRRDLFDVEDWRATHTVEYLADALLRGDTLNRYRAYAVGRQWGWLSANDVRRLENQNPVEGGDAYLTPTNMTDSAKAPAAADPYQDDPAPAKPNGQARSLQ